jgi:putative toxin-antitoxin system antitoxin component (TIGR02293 family)
MPTSPVRTRAYPRPLRAAHDSAGGTPLGVEDCAALYRTDAAGRIAAIREGLPADFIASLAGRMGVAQEQVLTWLGLARATVSRKVREGVSLSQDETERALALARLVGQVETMVAESGDPEGFDAPAWTAHWLSQPNPALGDSTPGEWLDTADGRALVASLLLRMQTGAYA